MDMSIVYPCFQATSDCTRLFVDAGVRPIDVPLLRVGRCFADCLDSVPEFPLQFINLIEYLNELFAKLR